MRNDKRAESREQRPFGLRTKRKNFLTLLIFTFSFFFCLSCDTIVDPPKADTPASGYGRISVTLTAGEPAASTVRTVFPSTLFDRYEYTFTKAGGAPAVKAPDTSGYFTLEVGNYTVAVQAFIGTAGSYTLAASGESEQFSVGPSDNTPVKVILTETITTGQGELKYTVTYPAGATAVITLRTLPGLTDITLTPSTGGNSITGTCSLPAGFYLLTMRVEATNNRYAGISEVVYIYPLLTTEYTKDFATADLVSASP